MFRCENNLLSSCTQEKITIAMVMSLMMLVSKKSKKCRSQMLWYFIGVHLKHFSTDAERFLISAWPCNVFYLLYELERLIGIPTTDKNCMSDVLLALFSAMSLWITFCFWNANKVNYSSLVRCLYNKQNMTQMLGDMEFLFSCSTWCLTCSLR